MIEQNLFFEMGGGARFSSMYIYDSLEFLVFNFFFSRQIVLSQRTTMSFTHTPGLYCTIRLYFVMRISYSEI